MIDVTTEINAVQRTVGSRTLEAGEARTVTVRRTYNTAVDDVWDACTNPERIPRWFLPISGDLRLGGRYQLEGNAGGTVESCNPPHAFTATWEYGGDVTWIELRPAAGADANRLGAPRFGVLYSVRGLARPRKELHAMAEGKARLEIRYCVS